MTDPVTALAIAYAQKKFSELAEKLADKFVATLTSSAANIYAGITTNFRHHLEITYNRCTKVKTILNKDEPTDLLSLYVKLKFEIGKKKYDDYRTISRIKQDRRAIIWGSAGTGKTIFMKYLWLTFFESPPDGRIPIYVELRNLNDEPEDNLVNYIFKSIAISRGKITRNAFESAIVDGRFIFMFDGFDELLDEKRRTVERQILELSNNNLGCIVVVSTRPDDRIASWQSFSIFHVLPLDQKQVVSLISKIKYEPKTKSKFIERIKTDLFRRHQSFLSSPLLATMMLMTFDQFADIPEKVYLFYDQAFDTLFSKHDAVKEAFKRRMHSGLPIDVFKRYFSYFCLLSYFEQKYEFSDTELADYFKRGVNIEGVTLDAELFMRDLLESVCILQRDGLKVVFSHRSFQEFFYGL